MMPTPLEEIMQQRAYGPYVLRKRYRHDDIMILRPESKSFSKRILDLENRTFLGRTSTSWSMFILFFVIYYAFVLSFFVGVYYFGYLKTYNTTVPKYLRDQPDLCIEPVIKNTPFRVYEYKMNIDETFKPYQAEIYKSLSKYDTNLDRFKTCRSQDNGIYNRDICLYLKINCVIGWKAETYESADELPKEAPEELRDHLRSLKPHERKNRIWWSCSTTNKNIDVYYHPERFVFAKYTYYAKAHKYTEYDLNRVITAQFKTVPLDKRVIVTCYAWAKNMEIDPENEIGRGTLRLGLYIQSTRGIDFSKEEKEED